MWDMSTYFRDGIARTIDRGRRGVALLCLAVVSPLLLLAVYIAAIDPYVVYATVLSRASVFLGVGTVALAANALMVVLGVLAGPAPSAAPDELRGSACTQPWGADAGGAELPTRMSSATSLDTSERVVYGSTPYGEEAA